MQTEQNQRDVSLVPVPKGEHLKFEDIEQISSSNWYQYTLICGHIVYTRTRIRVPENYSYMEHYIRCHEKHLPLQWQAIVSMEAVTDEHVSNVSSGTSFILPNRILRVDGHYSVRFRDAVTSEQHEIIRGHNSGNPYPYRSRDRDY